ncbi:MAG: hypothetical protein IT213_17795 [Cytophagales bacterium]|nr:hypothetical protein [Cytophagales bacterium]
MEDCTSVVLVTIDITGAVIYSSINPFTMSIWDEDLYDEYSDSNSERTFLKFILATIFHSLFIFTWIGGFITIYQLAKKGKYFKVLKNDIHYLGKVIDAYLLSEVKKMEDEEIDAEVDRLEKLFNKYQIMVHYIDRDNPNDIQYKNEARDIFKRRSRLKIRTTK